MTFLIGNILWPFLDSFLFAGIFASVLLPVQKKVEHLWGKKHTLLSVGVLLLFTAIISIPTIFIVSNVIHETKELKNYVDINAGSDPMSIISSNIVHYSEEYLGVLLNQESVTTHMTSAKKYLVDQVGLIINFILSNLMNITFKFALFLMALFIILTKSSELKSVFFKLSLLPTWEEEVILDKFQQLNKALIIGNTLSGIIHASFGLSCFLFLGFEKVFFWSLLLFITSFIPVVGTSVLFIPMGAYLYLTGQKTMAVFLVILLGIVFVVVENWFKPKFIGSRVKMNSFFVLLCMLGGVKLYGISGLFYGPITSILFLTFMDLLEKRKTNDFATNDFSLK
jgi:predicted PurR-regulated permease PerM